MAASVISVEVGFSVALIELFLGVVVGNVFSLAVPDWLNFIGSFAGIVLTFLAGAEVDVPQFRREWRASLSIGLVSFFGPFVVVGLLAYYGLGWNHRQAEIGAIHAISKEFKLTNWKHNLSLYDLLMVMQPTPVVAINRAIRLVAGRRPGDRAGSTEGHPFQQLPRAVSVFADVDVAVFLGRIP